MTRGRVSGSTGSPKAKEWFGVYLGRIVQTRLSDVCVKVQVPQLLGMQSSNWARPMGFNVVGQLGGPNLYSSDVNSVQAVGQHSVTGTGVTDGIDVDNLPASFFGAFVTPSIDAHATRPGRALGFASKDGPGPGPPPGTIVLVQFIGGDVNVPCYALTTQKVDPGQ
jgi:hypothetical protein